MRAWPTPTTRPPAPCAASGPCRWSSATSRRSIGSPAPLASTRFEIRAAQRAPPRRHTAGGAGDGDARRALPELAARAWAGLGEPSPPRAPHVRVGRGLACNFQPYGRIVWLHDWASAWVGFEMDGSLVVRCGVPDVGGGRPPRSARSPPRCSGSSWSASPCTSRTAR